MDRLSNDKLKEMYLKMLQIRESETRVAALYQAGEIPGFLHSYLGEEAVAVGACAALNADDYITSTHRGHGHLIAKGGRLDRMLAELFGKETGYCRGKGGSMHIADVSLGIIGANGIVGAGLPIANGAALTAKLKKTSQVVVCFFGDGASNQGTFHEALNLASLWRLPVVFVCENNLYALSTPLHEHCSVSDIAVRCQSYGMPGIIADGNDVLDVYAKVGAAVERARQDGGPSLVECKTYRTLGHYVGDPMVYRPDEEEEAWAKKDPLPRFRLYLLENKVMTEEELQQMEAEVKAEVEAAIRFAKESPAPRPEEAIEDVYVDWRWGGEYR